MKKTKVAFTIALSLLSISAFAGPSSGNEFNYAQALQKSIFFYDAQRAGPVSQGVGTVPNRVNWRADATMSDGACLTGDALTKNQCPAASWVDLTKGYYDAGDNPKFGLPMAESISMLAWSVVDFGKGYQNTNQLVTILANIKWGTDFLLNATVMSAGQVQRIYGQVGSGNEDHSVGWMPYEALDASGLVKRYGYYIDKNHPGTDLAEQYAAALTASSMAFTKYANDPAVAKLFDNSGYTAATYAQKLLDAAKAINQFAMNNPKGVYSDPTGLGMNVGGVWTAADASNFYRSWSGYNDEINFAHVWLYRATGDASYLTGLKIDCAPSGGTQSWDDNNYGTLLLLAATTPNATCSGKTYKQAAADLLTKMTSGSAPYGFTPGGMLWIDGLSTWGALRYAMNTAFLAAIYNQKVDTTAPYNAFVMKQVNYLLGNNPNHISYMVGFGTKFPQNIHHATAQGPWQGYTGGGQNPEVAAGGMYDPKPNRHIDYGALAGGPDKQDGYIDDRNNYYTNEVAMDYNAGLVATLATVNVSNSNGNIDSAFPQAETPDGLEYIAGGYIDNPMVTDNLTTISGKLQFHNHSAWPAQVTTSQQARIYLNFSKDTMGTKTPADVLVNDQSNNLISLGNNIYYFTLQTSKTMYPQQAAAYDDVKFSLSIPWKHDVAQDWSLSQFPKTQPAVQENMPALSHVAVFIKGKQVAGTAPVVTAGTIAINFTSSTGSIPSAAVGKSETVLVDGSSVNCMIGTVCTVNDIATGAHTVNAQPLIIPGSGSTPTQIYNFDPQSNISVADKTTTTVNIPFGAAVNQYSTPVTFNLKDNGGAALKAAGVPAVFTLQNAAGNQTCAVGVGASTQTCNITVQYATGSSVTYTVAAPSIGGYSAGSLSSNKVVFQSGQSNPTSVSATYTAIPIQSYAVSLSAGISGGATTQAVSVVFTNSTTKVPTTCTVNVGSTNNNCLLPDTSTTGTTYTVETPANITVGSTSYVASVSPATIAVGAALAMPSVKVQYALPASCNANVTINGSSTNMGISGVNVYSVTNPKPIITVTGNYSGLLGDAWSWAPADQGNGVISGVATGGDWQNTNSTGAFGFNVKGAATLPTGVSVNGNACTVNGSNPNPPVPADYPVTVSASLPAGVTSAQAVSFVFTNGSTSAKTTCTIAMGASSTNCKLTDTTGTNTNYAYVVSPVSVTVGSDAYNASVTSGSVIVGKSLTPSVAVSYTKQPTPPVGGACKIGVGASTWVENGVTKGAVNLYIQNLSNTDIQTPWTVVLNNPNYLSISAWNDDWKAAVSGGVLTGTSNKSWEILNKNGGNAINLGGQVTFKAAGSVLPTSATLNGQACTVVAQ